MVMTPGEVQRTKGEADAAWEAVRKAQGVVQRMIDEPAMPRAYRQADLEEARRHLGTGLKAINATRHRLELATLLGGRTMSMPLIRHERHVAKFCPGPLGKGGVVELPGTPRISDEEMDTMQRRIIEGYHHLGPEDCIITVAPAYQDAGWHLPNVTETHETTEAGELIESHTIYSGMGGRNDETA